VTDSAELTAYSIEELGNLIRDLRLQIVVYQAQLEVPTASRQRTIKIIRNTILTAGGIYGATFTLAAAILAVLGFWDWIDTIRSDVATMNRQIRFRRALTDLTQQLIAAESELDRRIAGVDSR
jgi:hypothetical protein